MRRAQRISMTGLVLAPKAPPLLRIPSLPAQPSPWLSPARLQELTSLTPAHSPAPEPSAIKVLRASLRSRRGKAISRSTCQKLLIPSAPVIHQAGDLCGIPEAISQGIRVTPAPSRVGQPFCTGARGIRCSGQRCRCQRPIR